MAPAACCACGEPAALKAGQHTLAAFEVEPVPQVTREIEVGICRTCARRASAAWARRMRGKTRPLPVDK
jgi:NMD protein affecting ribosome stability and mRNA decay